MREPRLAGRMSRVGESATMRVARCAAELRRRGRDVVDLSAGEPDFPSPPAAVEAAVGALREGLTRYTPAAGLPELRQALAASYRDRYGSPWTAEDTVVTVGAKAALFELALALFEPGTEVVIPSPSWVSFAEQVVLAGADPVPVPCSFDDGFRIHAGPLLEAVTERTRAILVNSPCNPTGGVLGADDLRTLAEGCAERGLLLIADETYEHFVYEGEHAGAAALAGELPETVVVVSSFSKTWAMTGWRVGWMLGPRKVVEAVTAVQSHATSNPTSFAMVGALAALEKARGEIQPMLHRYRSRRKLVVSRLGAMEGVECYAPAGAFYAFPRVSAVFREGGEGSLELAERLLEEAGVAVVPGVAFGADDHLRLSFAASEDRLRRGLDRIGEVLGGR